MKKLLLAALAATLGVGAENLLESAVGASSPEDVKVFALLNRLLAAASFVLVGGLVVVLNRSQRRVSALEHEREHAEREAALREAMGKASANVASAPADVEARVCAQ